jgi:hypothetical protein
MSEEEKTRFDFFVRSHFGRRYVMRILEDVVGNRGHITQEIGIVVSGLAKLFVGELMDTSSEVLKRELRALECSSGGDMDVVGDGRVAAAADDDDAADDDAAGGGGRKRKSRSTTAAAATVTGATVAPEQSTPSPHLRPSGICTRHVHEAARLMQRDGKIRAPPESHFLFGVSCGGGLGEVEGIDFDHDDDDDIHL